VGRNCLRGPAQTNLDLGVRKSFSLGESRTLRFRVDFFNTLNHENLANPISNLNAVTSSGGSLDPNTGAVVLPGNFGKVIASTSNPRIIQLSLSLKF